MNEALIIWLYLSLGSFFDGMLLFFIVVATGAMAFATIIPSESEIEDYLALWKKYYPLKTVIIISILTCIYPSKDDLKYIIGGAVVWGGIERTADIEGINQLPENLVGAANRFLEDLNEGESDEE